MATFHADGNLNSDVDRVPGTMKSDVDLTEANLNSHVDRVPGTMQSDVDLTEANLNSDGDRVTGTMQSDVDLTEANLNSDGDRVPGTMKSDVDIQDGGTSSDVGLLKSLYSCLCQKRNSTMSISQFHSILQRTLISYQSRFEDIQSRHEDKQIHDGNLNKVLLMSRPEVLLMLACVTALFEEENTSRILSEELHHSHILHTLLDLVYCEERFTSFAAATSLLAGLKCRHFPNMDGSVLGRIIDGATQTERMSLQFSSLDLLKRFMSNRAGKDLNDWCFLAARSSRVFRAAFAETAMTDGEDLPDIPDIPLGYLTLVQKTVKYINKMDKDAKLSTLESVFHPVGRVLIQSLATSLGEIDIPRKRMRCKKILDVFNSLFDYGNSLSQVRRVPGPYVGVARRLLSVVSPSVLVSVPCVRQFVGFGGSVVDETTTEKSGDPALQKKLLLLLVTSSAIVLKADDVSHEDKMLAISTMDGIRDFMKNLLMPGDIGGIQWLPLVFGDQDDAWIEMILALLDCHLNIQRLEEQRLPEVWHPHPVFLSFLESSSSDHMILVDLLTSPETCFLLYFLRYLKCVACEWDAFVDACHNSYQGYCSPLRQCELFSDTRRSNNPCTGSVKKAKLSGTSENGETVDSFPSFKYTSSLAALAVYSDGESSDENIVTEHTSQTSSSQVGSAHAVPTTSQTPPPPTNNAASLAPRCHFHGKQKTYRSSAKTVTTEIPNPLSEAASGDPSNRPFRRNHGNIRNTESPRTQYYKHGNMMDTSSSRRKSNPEGSDVPNIRRCVECDRRCVECDRRCVECDRQCVECDCRCVECDCRCVECDRRCVKCDRQCLEHVMSVMIRVRLRIRGLSHQDLFPYNPGPLLSILEQVEGLYEEMGSEGSEGHTSTSTRYMK